MGWYKVNKRISALILIGAIALAMLSGCKADDDEINLDYSGGEQQLQFDDDDTALKNPSEDQENQTSGKPNDSATDETPDKKEDGGQNDTPSGGQSSDADDSNGEKPADKNTPSGESNQDSSSVGLKETFAGSEPIKVSAGETVWYGPASTAQKEQLTFTDSAGKTTKVETDQLQKVDTFNNGYVIYAYKASAAGSVTLQVPETYKDLFLATKETMDLNVYYTYWDNIKDRNLFVASLDKSSKQVDIDGKLKNSENSNAMHAIPVKEGDTLTFAPVSPATMVLGCGYDAKMKPVDIISGYGLKESIVFTHGMRAYTYTVPAGVSFVRFNVPKDEHETYLVMKNKEFDVNYYTRTMKVAPEHLDNPLKGKTCLFIGDSLCSAAQDTKIDGQRGWARRVKQLSGAIPTNVGRGGPTFSDVSMKDPDATEYHVIYKQLYRTAGQKFDYILLEGGGNDARGNAPIGKPSKGYNPDYFDLSTFAGGMEMMIYTAIKEYGDTAALGFLMAYKMPRSTKGVLANKMGDYYAVAAEICKKWDISYLDMYNNDEIYAKLNPMGTEHVPDGIHADDSGYDIIGPYINEYMKSMTPVTQRIRDELAAIED